MIATASPVDLNAERAASRARRDNDHQDTSARVLLRLVATGGWLGGLEEWAAHQHPTWGRDRLDALVKRARELHAEERGAISPAPTDGEPDMLITSHLGYGSPSDRASQEERAAEVAARVAERTRAAAADRETDRPSPPPEPEPVAEPAAEESMPKTATPGARPATSDIRRVLTELLTDAPETRFAEAQQILEERYGVPFKGGNLAPQWKRVLATMGLEDRTVDRPGRGRPRKGAAPQAPAERAAKLPPPAPAAEAEPEPAAVEEPTQPEPTPERTPDVAAVLEENRSLRATYEDGEGMHLEEFDGEWRIRMNLIFDTRDEALQFFTRLFAVRG